MEKHTHEALSSTVAVGAEVWVALSYGTVRVYCFFAPSNVTRNPPRAE